MDGICTVDVLSIKPTFFLKALICIDLYNLSSIIILFFFFFFTFNVITKPKDMLVANLSFLVPLT